jgi:hypothetical protein
MQSDSLMCSRFLLQVHRWTTYRYHDLTLSRRLHPLCRAPFQTGSAQSPLDASVHLNFRIGRHPGVDRRSGRQHGRASRGNFPQPDFRPVSP